MERKEEINPDQSLTEYIQIQIERELNSVDPSDMVEPVETYLISHENTWMLRELIIIKGASHENLKQEWKNILENKDLTVKDAKNKINDDATLRKKFDICKKKYEEEYKLKDSKEYPFNVMFYLFYKDYLKFNLDTPDQYIEIQLQTLQQVEITLDSVKFNLTNTIDRLKRGQIKIINEMNMLKKREKFYEKLNSIEGFPFCNIITKLDEKIPFTPLQPDHDLWYYFNKVNCNDMIPFCTYQNFYKFIENCPVKSEWLEEIPEQKDAIICYVKFNEEYQKIYISTTFIIVQLEFSQENTPEDILRQLSYPTSFSLPELVSSPFTQKSIKSICYMNIPFLDDKYKNIKLLLYFVQSHKDYSSILFAEESRVIMSDRQYLFLTYYTNPKRPKEYVSFNIRFTDKEDAQKMECFEDETGKKTYMKLTIKHCPNSLLVEKTVSMLTSLLHDFVGHYDKILDELKKIKIKVPEMKHVLKKEVKASTKHEVIIGRTRGQQHRPSIYQVPQDGQPFIIPLDSFYHRNIKNEPEYLRITEEKNLENKRQDLIQGLIFPKDGKNWNETKYFVCDREKQYKYVDLKELQEGYVPYCYTNNKDGNKSNLNKFLSEEKKEEKSKKPSNYIPIRGNILDPDQFGSVLQWMKRWYILSQPERFLFRKGVSRDTKKSILYLLEIVKQEIDPLPKKIINENYINKLHIKLLKEITKTFPFEIMTEAVPLFPGHSLEEIIKKCIEQFKDGYINPLLFYSFLAKKYNMDLVFFKKDGLKNPPFYLYHPMYYQLYQGKSYRQCVGVALNQGLEFWNSADPYCELIVSAPITETDENCNIKKKSNYDYTLTHCQPYIDQCLKEMYGKQIVDECIFFDSVITSQDFDRYGMTIKLNVELLGQTQTIFLLEPIHSLDKIHDVTIHLWTPESLHQFKMKYHLVIPQEYQSFGNYKGVMVPFQNKLFFIPIYKEDEENAMKQYIQFEKISRYMKEHTCYLFSCFVRDQTKMYNDLIDKKNFHERNKEEDELKAVLTELSTRTLLQPSTLYGYLDQFVGQEYIKMIHIEDDEFVKQFPKVRLLSSFGKQIAVPSEDIIRKLIYMLMIEYQTNRDELLEYASQVNIRNYYVYPYDLDSIPMHQIMTRTSFISFLKNKNNEIKKGSLVPLPRISTLFTKKDEEDIQVFKADGTPYKLFKNFIELPMIHQWIMQPVSSISQAIFLSEKWNRNGINAINEWNNKFILENPPEEDFHSLEKQLEQCNQFIWSSDTEYEFIPSIHALEVKLIPVCISVFRIKDKKTPQSKTYIHVMLPC